MVEEMKLSAPPASISLIELTYFLNSKFSPSHKISLSKNLLFYIKNKLVLFNKLCCKMNNQSPLIQRVKSSYQEFESIELQSRFMVTKIIKKL